MHQKLTKLKKVLKDIKDVVSSQVVVNAWFTLDDSEVNKKEVLTLSRDAFICMIVYL